MQQSDMQIHSIQINPTMRIACKNASVTASPGRNAYGSMTGYKYFYKVFNGSESKSRAVQSGPGAKFQTLLSEKRNSLEDTLQQKMKKVLTTKLLKKTNMVEPVDIKIVLE
jgi:hypothetical protein